MASSPLSRSLRLRFGTLAAAPLWAEAAKKDAPKGDLYTLDTCAVSGGKLGGMGDPVIKEYDGREIRSQAIYWSGLSHERLAATMSKDNYKGIGAAMQKAYALVGALFLPMLAAVLLLLNGRTAWVGAAHRNRPVTSVALLLTLGFFAAAGWLSVSR